MHAEVAVSISTLYGFLLVLARVSGLLITVPLPGLQGAPDPTRILLALGLTVALAPKWPNPAAPAAVLGQLVCWMAAETAFGLLVGEAVAFVLEGAQMAAQMIGLQAGYSFASTIDPNTQADSTILQQITQLFAGCLFFCLGLDREVIRILAYSLEKLPAGSYFSSASALSAMLGFGSAVFVVGVRLSLPVLALLLLLDLAFAILGKVHAQLQLQSLSFAAKMLAALGLMASTLAFYPMVGKSVAMETLGALRRTLIP
jgi:flagellar biosynthetic protein FliR